MKSGVDQKSFANVLFAKGNDDADGVDVNLGSSYVSMDISAATSHVIIVLKE